MSNPHYEGKPSGELELPEEEKRLEIKPNKLNIIWGNDNRYWKVPLEDGPAELYQVSWLEVTGCVSKTKPEKEYEVGFHISLTPDAFGWTGSPVYILVKRGKTGKFKGHKFSLDNKGTDGFDIKAKTTKFDQIPTDEDANAKEENSKLYFGLYEVWRGKWKGGLKIHHAFIQQIM